jgi:cyclic pyranopterin phosphate synthase
MAPETLGRIRDDAVAKGDVLATARLAGIQAAKRTSDWIPLAHPLPLDLVEVDLTPDAAGGCLRIEARVRATARTGVEMEALVAVSAAALTVYDMCKSIDRSIPSTSSSGRKSGGKSGRWERDRRAAPGDACRVDIARPGRTRRGGRVEGHDGGGIDREPAPLAARPMRS